MFWRDVSGGGLCRDEDDFLLGVLIEPRTNEFPGGVQNPWDVDDEQISEQTGEVVAQTVQKETDQLEVLNRKSGASIGETCV